MSNMSALQREVNQIVADVNAAWEAQQPATAHILHDWFGAMDLLAEQERTQLQQFLVEISPRIKKVNGHWNFDHITDDELDRIGLWEKLIQAIERNDQAATTNYRRFLSWTTKELVEHFLALNLDDNTNWRYLKINATRREPALNELEQMRELLEAFA